MPPDRYAAIRDEYIKTKFAAEISEIEALAADLEITKAAFEMSLSELQAASEMSGPNFSKLVESLTAEIDGVK